ncbi:MAG: LPS export ABC transporter ATP-binding protein [Holosporales bacterium]|jgi:lipopolysaccharide export system ATP-binding protein|nr:LPS export ABC transporter ATP-binding protein [Holosporales bacterium]
MIFEANKITKSFKERMVLNGVDVLFKQGEIVGILGPNGAGKTTLFSILTGITYPDTGQITIDGKDILKLKVFQRAREGIVYLPQDSSIFRGLSVEDNIRAILQLNLRSNDEIVMHLERLLDAFSISHLRKANAPVLSGGERRKVEIARTLATFPKFLMLDEPFSGIDPISISEIIDIIKRLKEAGIGIIITDHNVRETLRTLDRGYIIANGKILVKGTSDAILQNDIARQTYLGNEFRI